MKPHAGHAKARRQVRFTVDGVGRIGTLIYMPIDSGRRQGDPTRCKGAKARVQLASGKYVGVAPEDLELVEEDPSPTTSVQSPRMGSRSSTPPRR